MGKYLDIIRARQEYEINEIDERNGAKTPDISCNSFISYREALSDLERRRPDFVPVARWQQAVEDGRRFLSQWAEQAEALGWTAGDLFGLHEPPAKPHPSYSRLSRYDRTGLVWLLAGRSVVVLTAETATIRTLTGTSLTYRRPVQNA
jgi:hypothetical protein